MAIDAILLGKIGSLLSEVLTGVLKQPVKQILDDRATKRALQNAVKRAENRFNKEYRQQDPELTEALLSLGRFVDLPSVETALTEMFTHPLHDQQQPVATVTRSFEDVLPDRIDRARVDAAVRAFLHYLGQEVLYIPQLQDLYALGFQKISAENARLTTAGIQELVQGMQGMRADLRQLPEAITPSPVALPPPARIRPWHNLPQRLYTTFVGRESELEKLKSLMLPYPRSRHYMATIDGIGGVGKSALALELAHFYREYYELLPPEERFEVIVWVSAKRTLLTNNGIQQRQQNFSTLGDLYREIAHVLEISTITQAEMEQRRGLVEGALTRQRTLLILDNLETVDDEALLSFLYELPDPTKAIVTTRRRINIAYEIRLNGMPHDDALELMRVEEARHNVTLTPETTEGLYGRTGGIPLAIQWSIGLIGQGYSPEGVLRRLGSGQSDVALFCFQESVNHLRGRDSYRLLMALALFESSVSRTMLGEVAGLGSDEFGRDDALVELLSLSLINQKGERFTLLPLTHSYVLAELGRQPALEAELRENWITYLTHFFQAYTGVYSWQADRRVLRREGEHLVTLAKWVEENKRPEMLLKAMPALNYYFDVSGQWAEMLEFGKLGLEQARLVGDLQSIVIIEIRALTWVLSQQGHHLEAEFYVKNALEAARQLGSLPWQCQVLIRYSQILRRRKAFDESLEKCQEALDLLKGLPQPDQAYMEADLEYELGRIARDQGRWHEARAHFLAARDLSARNDDDTVFNYDRAWGIMGQLGFVAQQLGELETAETYYRQALELCRELGGPGNLTTLYIRLATLEEQRGNRVAALDYARQALIDSLRLGMVQEQAQAQSLHDRLDSDSI